MGTLIVQPRLFFVKSPELSESLTFIPGVSKNKVTGRSS